MRKCIYLAVLLAVVMVLVSCSSNAGKSKKTDDIGETQKSETGFDDSLYADSIEKALRSLKRTWEKETKNSPDGPYVDIKNTRIIGKHLYHYHWRSWTRDQ